MGFISLTKQDNQFILMNVLEKKEKLNDALIDNMTNSGFPGVVPFVLRKVKGKPVIHTEVTNTYSLLTRLQSPIDNREFIIILKGLLDSIKQIASLKIAPMYIDFDLDYIFIQKDGTVLMTMWAVEGLKPKRTLPDLLKLIGLEAKPKQKVDEGVIDGYKDFFDSKFDIAKFENYIMTNYNMIRESVMSPSGSSQGNLTRPTAPKPTTTREEEAPAVSNSTSTPTAVEEAPAVDDAFEENDDTGMIQPTGKTTVLADMVMDDGEDDGKTQMLFDNSTVTRYLKRETDGTIHHLTGNKTIVGKSPDSDVAITDNRAISRQHAEIFIFDGEVNLKDLGSSNGTKVNGKVIEKGDAVFITDQDTITFANDDFIYCEE